MQTIKIESNKIVQEQIDSIVDYLKRGLVIAYPTDTVCGLGCDARNAEAIKRINKVKGER
ncbi:MAG: Sua5/YciO/YrdC/YwlC family protein, partial [bacterium]|nr:Sua5/YciO/YrdC/YwlC family protein [bacterium]